MNKATAAHAMVPVLGAATGLRSMTGIAAVAWFARCGALDVEDTWASWVAHPATVAITSLAAAGEYVGDKLPSTPNRTDVGPLVGRLGLGALCGAIVATALKRPAWRGALLGAAGAAAGTYGGFYARKGLVKGAGLPDLPVALSGDVAAATMAVRALQRLTT